jgi:hypothetical protein
MKIIIYVVCHGDASEAVARQLAIKYPELVPYRMPNPQSHLFEARMFTTELLKMMAYWASADYVGMVSYAIEKKDGNIKAHLDILKQGLYDFVPLLPSKHDHLGGHSTFVRRVLEDTANKLGLKTNSMPVCFCNAWTTRPVYMRQYIQWFSRVWLPTLERHPFVWKDAKYKSNMTRERLLEISGGRSDKYACHPFCNERIVWAYFRSIAAKSPAYLVDAKYGAGKTVRVHEQVLKASGQALVVTNATMGSDPIVGTIKTLSVHYMDERGMLSTLQASEGSTLQMPQLFKARP